MARLAEEVRKALTDKWPQDGTPSVLVPAGLVEQAFSEEEIAYGFDSGWFRLMMDSNGVMHVWVALQGQEP